jgi:hypothetical protein
MHATPGARSVRPARRIAATAQVQTTGAERSWRTHHSAGRIEQQGLARSCRFSDADHLQPKGPLSKRITT